MCQTVWYLMELDLLTQISWKIHNFMAHKLFLDDALREMQEVESRKNVWLIVAPLDALFAGYSIV